MFTVDRYVWAHRMPLARSVHDMAKQMYANRKYSDAAWAPLHQWLFDCEDEERELKAEELTRFNKDSAEFFTVVAQCLWNLANGSNMPWGGRSATETEVYDRIPVYEKVRVKCDFFFCRLEMLDTYMCSTSSK